MYDVIIAGGGPAGLSVGSELSKSGYKVAVIERGIIGDTQRAWIVPGYIIESLEDGVKECAYNGVKRFLEYTSGLEIKWNAEAPWDGSKDWKRYPYIKQEKLLKYWANIIKKNSSSINEKRVVIDYVVENGIVKVKSIDNETKEVFIDEAKLLIDATGYSSQIAKRNLTDREGYFWWSVYGEEIEFENIESLKHPGNLGNMQVGDYMLWQSFDDMPMDKKETLSQLRPIMEYEVLDDKTVFVFILYFAQKVVDKDYMKAQFDYILNSQESIKSFKAGKAVKERFGYYPSNSLSQKNSVDNVALIGDSGCWTIPAGWGMTFILQNYKIYSKNISKLIKENKLSAKYLNEAVEFNQKQEFQIVMDKLVLHFLAYAEPKLIDKFTKTVFDSFGGKQLEIMFCLQMSEKQALKILKEVLSKFSAEELISIFKKKEDYLLILKMIKEFCEAEIVDTFLKLLKKKEEEAGFEFQTIKESI
jgi:flavin-dependent dehydrogenase